MDGLKAEKRYQHHCSLGSLALRELTFVVSFVRQHKTDPASTFVCPIRRVNFVSMFTAPVVPSHPVPCAPPRAHAKPSSAFHTTACALPTYQVQYRTPTKKIQQNNKVGPRIRKSGVIIILNLMQNAPFRDDKSSPVL